MRSRIRYQVSRKMRRAAFIMIALCLVFPGSSAASVPHDAGAITTDLNDSDQFFQNAIRSRGPERDYSPQIETLLRRMTVEEKVGQMTQLTLEMIVNGHDQNLEIDPAKLQK